MEARGSQRQTFFELKIFAEIFSPPLASSGASPERYFDIVAKAEHRRSGCDALPAPPVGLRRPPPRDIEVVVESALSLVVGGFRTMELAFSVSVSATKIWLFPPLDFCFLRDLSASSPRQCLGLFDGLDALPFVCRWGPPLVEISQPKFMR